MMWEDAQIEHLLKTLKRQRQFALVMAALMFLFFGISLWRLVSG